MSRLKCRCGNVLDDEDRATTELLLAVPAARWEAGARAPRAENAGDFRYALWRCRECERWFVFEPSATRPKLVLCPEAED
jgi:hypothetical protein